MSKGELPPDLADVLANILRRLGNVERRQSPGSAVAYARVEGSTKSMGNSAWTTIDWNAEDDALGLVDPATGIFTMPDNYLVAMIGAIRWPNNATGSRGLGWWIADLYVPALVGPAAFTTSVDPGQVVTWVGKSVAGDQWKLKGWQNSGGALVLDGGFASWAALLLLAKL